MPRALERIRREPVHAALVASLALIWANFLSTARWADVEGALRGPKAPWFAMALTVATVLLLRSGRATKDSGPSPLSVRVFALMGSIALATVFLVWFPVATWRLIPFLDDWPIRFHAALDMMRMIDSGSLTGWEWRFLGGYHSSSDATQGLGTLTYLPMKLFGAELGFHLAHVALFAAVPAVVWWDLRQEPHHDARVTATAVGLAAVFACGYGYTLMRSGDTNSLGGVVVAMVTLAGAHASRVNRPWGVPVLVAGLALTAYAHPGFFVYTSAYLMLDAFVARDWPSAVRAVAAIVTGLIASLPLTFESWRYPDLFSFNNVVYTPPQFNAGEVLRSLYYSVELLWQPGRWFNDYTGLAVVFTPVSLAVAWVDRTRVRFYAVAAVFTLLLMRLVNVHTGYVFLRPMHLLPIWMAVVIAAVAVTYVRAAAPRWSLIAVVVLYIQVWAQPIPHVRSIRDFDAALTDHVAAAPGALVLLENNPHRNMNADPGGTTERSRFGTHFEPMMAETTGRRLFSGGYPDGWQWNPWKGRVVAGGTFMGRSITATSHDTFVAELRRWGVAELFVWSDTSNRYLAEDSRFLTTWKEGAWTAYSLAEADTREVDAGSGRGVLLDRTPFSATVALTNVQAGERVVVRTNPHPAWTAESGGRAVALNEYGGQMSFEAPCAGDCTVGLHYPRRLWLWPIAGLALVLAMATIWRLDRIPKVGR